MGIDAVVETIEGLDKSLADLYVQDASSGKYRLNVNGGFKTASEIEGLSSALGKERSRAESAERELRDFKARYSDFDIEAGKRAMEQVATMTADQKLAGQRFEAELKARLDPVIKERDEARQIAKDTEARFNSMLVDTALASSQFIKEKVSKDPIHQSYVREHFRSHFKVEDGQIVAYGDDGNKIFDNNGALASVDVALSRLINALPNGQALLAGSSVSGSGATAGASYAQGAKVMRRSQFDGLSPQDKMKAIKSGVNIVD